MKQILENILFLIPISSTISFPCIVYFIFEEWKTNFNAQRVFDRGLNEIGSVNTNERIISLAWLPTKRGRKKESREQF